MDLWERGRRARESGRGFVSWGLPGPDPAALKGATGRIGKIPTYVKRSRALKSARSFSPKFRAGRRRVSPTPSPTSTNPLNVYLTRPGAPAPPLEPFWGVRISEHPKSRTCYEKPVLISDASLGGVMTQATQINAPHPSHERAGTRYPTPSRRETAAATSRCR